MGRGNDWQMRATSPGADSELASSIPKAIKRKGQVKTSRTSCPKKGGVTNLVARPSVRFVNHESELYLL